MIGPNADEVIAILADSTPIKDPEVYKAITPTGMNPDGKVNVQSLADDLAFEIDDLLPIVDAAQLLTFLKVEDRSVRAFSSTIHLVGSALKAPSGAGSQLIVSLTEQCLRESLVMKT